MRLVLACPRILLCLVFGLATAGLPLTALAQQTITKTIIGWNVGAEPLPSLLKYCHIAGGNFGDDLNTLIWPSLFPDLAKLGGRTVFYGVGTLLDGRHDKRKNKVVLGSGIGEANSALSDPNWDFRWVRGPHSAREFKLSKELALGDPAWLWRELQAGADGRGAIGLMPHYATWDSSDWVGVAANAGMVAINPRQAPAAVTAQMRRCSRILSESLRGAVCADAMGIPWSACVLAHRFNDFK